MTAELPPSRTLPTEKVSPADFVRYGVLRVFWIAPEDLKVRPYRFRTSYPGNLDGLIASMRLAPPCAGMGPGLPPSPARLRELIIVGEGDGTPRWGYTWLANGESIEISYTCEPPGWMGRDRVVPWPLFVDVALATGVPTLRWGLEA